MTRFTATTTALAALLATTSLAYAGGVERQGQSPSILFQEGTYVEFGYTYVDPDLSGTQQQNASALSLIGSESGDIAPSYSYSTFSYRQDITDQLSFAVIYDEPIGANVDYAPNGGSGYLYGSGFGSQAEIQSQALTLAARYEFTDRISAYAGLRAVTASGEVALFNGSDGGVGRYTLDAESDTELGFMIGAAYEIPDIALRVSLTYYSATNHTFTGRETSALGADTASSFETTIPQQLLLEAQSGIAEGTLLFGSVRWVDWSEFEIRPPAFNTQAILGGSADGASLVDYDSDTWTYTIGGARVLTDNWTALASLSYEASQGGYSGNLGPTDGRTSIGLGARYTMDNWTITGGINYTMVGDATTEGPGALAGADFGEFEDNSAVGFGLRVGYTF